MKIVGNDAIYVLVFYHVCRSILFLFFSARLKTLLYSNYVVLAVRD